MQTLIQSNIEALAQAVELLDGLPDEHYEEKKIKGLSGVGGHVRHVLDHYRALRAGLDAGTVDYDCRHRNCPTETDKQLAISELKAISNWLSATFARTSATCSTQAANAVGDSDIRISTEVCFQTSQPLTLDSTIRRELCYLLNHTVHHVAYMSLLIKHAGFTVSDTIGVAPATRIDQQAQQQAQQQMAS